MHKFQIIFFILIAPFLCKGQIKEYGIKLGVSNTKSSYQSANGSVKRNGNWAGSVYGQFYAELYHYSNFSLKTGIGIIERNSIAKYKVPNPNLTLSDSININESINTRNFFLAFEGKLKYQIPEVPKILPYFLFGPYFEASNKQSANLDFTLAPIQLNLMYGIGVDYDLKRASIFFEWQRLTNFNRNLSKDPFGILTQKSYIICFGFKFLVEEN